MRIYRAIKTDYKTQGFDAAPCMVEFYKKYGMTAHGGMDWGAFTGEPVSWDCDLPGTVLNTEVDNSGGLGINVITESPEGILKHRFWHLKGFYVNAGDKVEIGDLLGWADNTGASTGTHLHRDIKKMVRLENGSLAVELPGNGTYGTIRYDKWFENKFVLDTPEGKKNNDGLIRKILIMIIERLLKGRQNNQS